jgi:ketosteroid isomerase-like protein
VVVLGRFTMPIKGTARYARSEWAQVWTIEDGLVRALRDYVDTLAATWAHSPQ